MKKGKENNTNILMIRIIAIGLIVLGTAIGMSIGMTEAHGSGSAEDFHAPFQDV